MNKTKIYRKKLDKNERLVCSVQPAMFARLIVGLYYDIKVSNRVKWMIKSYCISLSSFICYLIIFRDDNFSLHPKLTSVMEYITYVTFSFLTCDKYLFRYLRFNPRTDGYPIFLYLCKKFEKFFKIIICLFVSFKILGVVLMMQSWPILSTPKYIWGTLALHFLWLASHMGRLVFILVYGILFCRMRTIRIIFENRGFQNTPQNRLTPKRYILMYEAVLNSIESVDFPVKFLIFTFICCFAPKLVVSLFEIMEEMKKGELSLTTFIWFLVELSPSYLFLLLSAIALDLVSEDVQELLSITIDRRLNCKNEKERSEIQEFFQYLRNNPFNYTLWQVVSLNLRTLLVATSFSIANVIAIMQIKNSKI
ncbi:uncharacterized protein LOC134200024 [Bombyx mori]|uniref:Gustatory receptor 26 n=1 Tax=Bombyx mori TaxID=7091 RepID=B7FF35_BOMMO|nr:TPA_inf: gustatory receptor 26 [Bombyx mori]